MMASRLRRPSSPAAGPLDDDDLLAEILLRLPPLPSSLPRASAVSRRWRSLVSDPRFIHGCRAHHRRNPPLFGCFVYHSCGIYFEPALEAPNRVPPCRFFVPIYHGGYFLPLGCRHGLALSLLLGNRLLVWDPVTGDQHHLDIPPGLDTETNWINGAVLRAAGDIQYFQVVLVDLNDMPHTHVVASVYSSETSAWGDLITLPHPSEIPSSFVPTRVYRGMPAVLIGGSLYWLVIGNSLHILEFDLDTRGLALIPTPMVRTGDTHASVWVMPAEGGGLGFLFLTGHCAQLWKREKDCDGVASWVPGRSVQLDTLLSLNPENERMGTLIVGFAEENNVVLLQTSIGVFKVYLESLQLSLLTIGRCLYCRHGQWSWTRWS